MSLGTPECEAHGGSSHARGKVDTVKEVPLNRCRPCAVIKSKRPPAVEINSFSSYPKNTHLRTNIYFGAERILGYSTDMSWTSSPRNMGKCPRKTHALTSQFTDLVSITTFFRWGE